MSIENNLPRIRTNSRPKDADSKVVNLEIALLARPLANVVRQLKNNIDQGQYALIIGDDAAGRIPTLAVAEIMDQAYAKKDIPPIDTRFLALYPPRTKYDKALDDLLAQTIDKNRALSVETAAKEKIIKEFVDKINKDELIQQNKKILIVTELISHGDALAPLVRALKEANIPTEIICMSAVEEEAIETLKLCGVGDVHSATGYFPQGATMTGVAKDRNRYNLRTIPIKNINPNQSVEDRLESNKIQRKINISRQDVHRVAAKVFEEVWGIK